MYRAAFRKPLGSVQTSSDGRTAHIHFVQHGLKSAQCFDLIIEAPGKTVELLSQSHRDCILQLGPAHLDYVVEFSRFTLKGIGEASPLLNQCAVAKCEGDVQR